MRGWGLPVTILPGRSGKVVEHYTAGSAVMSADKMSEVIVYRQHFEQFVGACAAGLRALELAN